MSELKFEKFEKIGRLKRSCIITEKIDGTNAQIQFDADGNMLVGSRKREIFPEGHKDKPNGCDNAGFARWAYENKDALWNFLGEGRHFGEWCGGKIQRGYGSDSKSFLLFNTSRFGDGKQQIPSDLIDAGLGVVPVLYDGEFTSDAVDKAMNDLAEHGSYFRSGFMNPEGVVIYHVATKSMFKVTYDHDMTGKGPNRQTDNVKG